MWLMKVKESQQFQFFASYAIEIHANEVQPTYKADHSQLYSSNNTKLRHQIQFLRVRRHQVLSMKRGNVFRIPHIQGAVTTPTTSTTTTIIITTTAVSSSSRKVLGPEMYLDNSSDVLGQQQ